jgi:hypothetical protein
MADSTEQKPEAPASQAPASQSPAEQPPTEQSPAGQPQAPTSQNPLVDILVQVELLGEPDDTAYAALHGGMTARDWLTTLVTDDGQTLPLPGGTYSGQTSEAFSDLSQSLHDWVVSAVWAEGAVVLVTELAGWSLAGDL